MESTERVLVIILAAALAVFLVLGIIALVKIIQILKDIKRISEKAVSLADKAETIGEFLRQSATPLSIMKLMANFFKNRNKTRRRGNK
jgi:hypothetical protein